jgi:hypothetical protein
VLFEMLGEFASLTQNREIAIALSTAENSMIMNIASTDDQGSSSS